jgi:predicted AlkP superfamily phosphohydrolase/phosphomutase
MSSRREVLAFWLDAADPRLVLDLIERGELPAFAGLRAEGSWTDVRSPAHIGNGAVYSSFFTGAQPERHGIFGGWAWRPSEMRVAPVRTESLRPFWGSLEDPNMTVGVLDVPLAPHVGLASGFELTEWGAHYVMQGHTSISPPDLGNAVEGDHPFASGRVEAVTPDDRMESAALASRCMEGAVCRGELVERLFERGRPDLTLIVFPETHRVAHDLWHTVEPDHPLYADLPANGQSAGPGLVDVYREVDRQIGRLADATGDDTALLVFSLHGMRPSRGVSSVLAPILSELGFTQPPRRGGWSSGAVGRSAFATVKRRTPSALKRLYHRRVPRDTRYRLAAPTMLPVLDWSTTRAFALPTDQHGWVRVNLRGREAKGAVAPEDYESTCAELQDALGGLRTEDGRPLVEAVVRADPSGDPPPLLPDLLVHWTDAALDRPVRVSEPAVEAWPLVPDRTGQHRGEGFCLARGLELPPGDPLEAADLSRLLLDAASGRS